MSDSSVINPELDPQQQPDRFQEKPPRVPKSPLWERPGFRTGLIVAGVVTCVFFFLFTFFYVKYSRMTDARLKSGVFAGAVNIYAAPRVVEVGDHLNVEETVRYLKNCGYSENRGDPTGRYHVNPDSVEIFPGKDSYFDREAGVLQFKNGRVSRIVSLEDNTERKQYQLEPSLITNLTDKNRERRRLIQFEDINANLKNALVSAEDKHFFRHTGIDIPRMVKAAWVDVKEGRKEQGASTLSMQLARGLMLDSEKRWRRKLAEIMITLHLEEKLSKNQIFEIYANQVYLGRRGSFSINGFGEAANAYFGKDVSQLNLQEAALLAGLVQRPSYFNPFRYPERAQERRNVVLLMMKQNGFIKDAEYERAKAAPVVLKPGDVDNMDANYFVDLVNDELQNELQDRDVQSNQVYTTLDLELQRAADDAIRTAMPQVDAIVKKQRKKKSDGVLPQVALIALDPHTGEIRALSGGRNYSASQLNHVLAKRQPGSIFKPFVFTAALNTAVAGGAQIFTPATVVDDSPATIQYDRQVYQPTNFHGKYLGNVTLRQALAHSDNNATVKVGSMVGFDQVVAIARRAGLNQRIMPTPAVALGAYEATPLELAGAYTIFANMGQYVKPTMVAAVRSDDGTDVYRHQVDARQALDPRVAYLMVNMLQEVLRSGTAAGARGRGFTVPAAGKTGTSRDGWFAGFTSDLLCLVWVGFDDNRDLNIEGAKSALPVWTEFMKRAVALHRYKSSQPFQQPSGITSAKVCPISGQLALPQCPGAYGEVFISGSEPVVQCRVHGAGEMQYAVTDQYDFGTPSGYQPVVRPIEPRRVEPRPMTPPPPTASADRTVPRQLPPPPTATTERMRTIQSVPPTADRMRTAPPPPPTTTNDRTSPPQP